MLFLTAGAYMINDEIYNIEQNNQPDYLSYHLLDDIDDIYKSFHIRKGFSQLKNFAVMSDGIYSFKKDNNLDCIIPIKKLLRDDALINSEAMLPRICNILKNDGYNHYDDLTIVRLINNNI